MQHSAQTVEYKGLMEVESVVRSTISKIIPTTVSHKSKDPLDATTVKTPAIAVARTEKSTCFGFSGIIRL